MTAVAAAVQPADPAGPALPDRLAKLADYPALSRLAAALLSTWPDHAGYLAARYDGDSADFLQRSDEVAQLALSLMGDDMERYCADYRWMCARFVEEEMHFRRTGRYRLQTFAQAFAEIYGDSAYMARYVRGILLSQIFWRNHACAIDLFRTAFLAENPAGYRHLEVGPGHGLFLYFAARDPRCAGATGWELSDASVAATRRAMETFEAGERIRLIQQDVLAAPADDGQADSAIISEVLEHLEQPEQALHTLWRALGHGGRLFVNVPINSPAPDHIYLWTEPGAVRAMVEAAGFEIEREALLPVTGYSLEQALARDLGVSCVLIGRKRGG